MKIRVADRLLVALSGLILILLAVCVADQTILPMGVVAALEKVMQGVQGQPEHALYIAAVIAVIVVLALLGLYCVGVLFRHQKKHKRGFVVQQTDCGELSIAVKAIEGLVQKCVDRHEEISVMATSLDTTRDGLIIKLRIGLAGGVNIPLAVSALQKQIKQYVSSCSGVDVKEVKVQVETSSTKGKASPYKVEELPEKAAPLPVVEDKTPVISAASVEAQENAEKRRPLHQRLFGQAEEPVTVAAPPAPVAEPAPAVEAAPEEEIAPVQETPAEVVVPEAEGVVEPTGETQLEVTEAPAEEEAAVEAAEEKVSDEEEVKHEDAE